MPFTGIIFPPKISGVMVAPTYNDRDTAHLIPIGISADCHLSPPLRMSFTAMHVEIPSGMSWFGSFLRFFGDPICSMYGIFTYIWLTFVVNVGKYSSPIFFRIWGWVEMCPGWFSSMHLLQTEATHQSCKPKVGCVSWEPKVPPPNAT